jgi:hypothetical protein
MRIQWHNSNTAMHNTQYKGTIDNENEMDVAELHVGEIKYRWLLWLMHDAVA